MTNVHPNKNTSKNVYSNKVTLNKYIHSITYAYLTVIITWSSGFPSFNTRYTWFCPTLNTCVTYTKPS